MTDVFERWPFVSLDNLPELLQQRWWAECFLSNQAYDILQNQPHWAVVTGEAGSGKTTLLRALKRVRETQDFVLEYTAVWQTHLHDSKSGIFSGIMALAAQELYYRFKDDPTLLTKIKPTQKEFFRWLIEKFITARSYLVFLDSLEPELYKLISDVSFRDLYPTQTETLDVQGQISELVTLLGSLGYHDILVFLDMPSFASEAQLLDLVDFLGWLEPMHHKGFVVIAALSKTLFVDCKLEMQMKGRAKVIPIQLTEDQIGEIVTRCLSAATGNKVQDLEQLVSKELLEKIEDMLCAEFDSITPGPLVKIVEIILSLREKSKSTAILDVTSYELIRSIFFLQHLQLRLDLQSERNGVWRGYRFIELETGPYDLLVRIFKSKVKTWGGTGGNEYLHTLASRLRKAIEPDPANPIYVKNRRGEGYWLEGIAAKSKT